MELVNKCATDSQIWNFQEILPILLDSPEEQTQLKPSRFLEEMILTTEERLEKLKKPGRQVFRLTKVKSFLVSPDIIIFQNFEAGNVYSITVSLMNLQEASKTLNFEWENSLHFTLTRSPNNMSMKVAPGISYEFIVSFYPKTLEDYQHQIKINTEGESFVVPIIAFGPRPIINFPDHIQLPPTGVRIEAEKTILIKNHGKSNANFILTATPPFCTVPRRAIIPPNEFSQFTILFNPTKIGRFDGTLMVHYETGEKLTITISATAENQDVKLEKSSVRFQDTYMGLSHQRNVKLMNNSRSVIRFKWKMYEFKEMDEEESRKIKEKLELMKEYETARCNRLETFNVIDYKGHKEIYERIYKDELLELDSSNKFMFSDKNFEIFPETGEVWPGACLDFTIIFKPDRAKTYDCTAYLDLTGRDERIPLKLSGIGVGPSVVLNVDNLCTNEIFLYSKHEYEIVAFNKGVIPATVTFQRKKTDFGGEISCHPEGNHLNPDECKAFSLQFNSGHQGKFIEEITFLIEESGEILKLMLSGKVTCPYLQVKEGDVNFGSVSIGFPFTKVITLLNTSQIAVPFSIEIVNDGWEPPLTCDEYSEATCKPFLPSNPKQLSCQPENGTVEPESTLTIELTLVANLMTNRSLTLFIYMWESTTHFLRLPVKYSAASPKLTCNPSEVCIRFCFVSHVYNRTFILKNENGYRGYYIVSQCSPNQNVTYEVSSNEGFIEPFGSVEIPVTIVSTFLGRDEATIIIKALGNQTETAFRVVCHGQGAICSVDPEVLNFNKVTLLETTVKQIKIVNESPIEAFIKVVCPQNCVFIVSPEEISLDAMGSIFIDVSVQLKNPGKYISVLNFEIENGEEKPTCRVECYGVGTSILCEPKLSPEMNLGNILTHQQFTKELKFTNLGKKSYKIEWSHQKIISTKNTEEFPPMNVFNLNPYKFTLGPDESIVVTLEGYKKEKGKVEEDFYCHAVIERSNKKIIIMSFIAIADFIEPTVELSKSVVHFKMESGPGYHNSFLNDLIQVTNKSTLPVVLHAQVKYPFYLTNDRGETVYETLLALDDQESVSICIDFKPSLKGKYSYVVEDTMKLIFLDHPQMEIVELKGQVDFPTVDISPQAIEFHCATHCSNYYQEIVLKNISSLPVTYHWQWDFNDFTIEKLGPISPQQQPYKPSDQLSEVSSEVSEDEPTEAIQSEVTQSEFIQIPLGLKAAKSKNQNARSEVMLREVEVYDRAAIEITLSYSYLQIQYTIDPSLLMSEALCEPEENKKKMELIRSLLFQMVETYDEPEDDVIVMKQLQKSKTECNESEISEILDVVPFHGYLEPYECQLISINFKPTENTLVNASLICNVEGGIPAVIKIVGLASAKYYELDQDYIEFGKKVFYETIKTKFTLTNIGYLEFNYEVILDSGDDRLCILPSEGLLNPQQTVEFDVSFVPRFIGEFTISVPIKIDTISDLTVTLHGYGVFPQIVLATSRPEFFSVDTYLQYTAIATITTDYLKPSKTSKNPPKQIIIEETIPKHTKITLKKEGWIVVSYNDPYPSTTDIDMAIERKIAWKHMFSNPSATVMLTKKKSWTISRLQMPPYLVDFGDVYLETVYHHTILIFNYGPVATFVRLSGISQLKNLEKKGIRTLFKSGLLDVGVTKEIYVIFSLRTGQLKKENWDICDNFCVEVKGGASIPVVVKARVSLPVVTYEYDVVDFGEVKCGERLKKTIILKNTGKLASTYTVNLIQPINKRHIKIKRAIYTTQTTKNYLEPNERAYLNVFFEPQYQGISQGILTIIVEQNPNDERITLKGEGVLPTLLLNEPDLYFGPILPNTIAKKTFRLQNVSPFPVEFIFSDFDNQIDQDEKILRLFLQSHGVEEIVFRSRTPGEGLPKPIVEFYYSLLDYIFLLQQELQNFEGNSLMEQKSKESCRKSSVVELKSTRSRQSYIVDSKSKIKRAFSCSGRSSIRGSTSSVAKNIVWEKTEEEISELLKKYQDDVNLKKKLCPDFIKIDNQVGKLTLDRNIKEEDPNCMRDGVLLIIHGAPETRYIETANKVGHSMKLPVKSLDNLIIEALIQNTSLATISVNETINKIYNEIASDIDLIRSPEDDAYDDLRKKLDLILTGKTKRSKPKHGRDSSKSSAMSSKSNQSDKPVKKEKKSASSIKLSKKRDKIETLLNINPELFTEILKQMLEKFPNGVIIESLRGEFVRKPLIALNCLLKAAGNLRYIQLIMLGYTFQDVKLQKDHLKQLEAQEQMRKAEEDFDKMLDMDIDSLSPDMYELYRERVLFQRKCDSLRKREAHLQRRSRKESAPEKVKEEKPSRKSRKNNSEDDKDAEKMQKSVKVKSTKKKGSTKDDKKSERSKSSKSKEKLSVEETELKLDFEDFEEFTYQVFHILQHWDRRFKISTAPVFEVKKKTATTKEKKLNKPCSSKGSITLGTNKSATAITDVATSEQRVKEIGIPFWYIRNCHPSLPIEELVINHLENTEDFMESLQSSKDNLNKKLTETSEVWTVLRYPPKQRSKNPSKLFKLCDISDSSTSSTIDKSAPDLISTDSSKKKLIRKLSTEQKTRKRRHSSDQKVSRRSADSDGSRKTIDIGNYEQLPFISRAVLQPGESLRYCVTFQSDKCEAINHTYNIETVGWPSKFKLSLKANCDIPRLDMSPAVIFPKVLPKRTNANFYEPCVFLMNTGIFDLGYALCQNGEKKPVESDLNFKNLSDHTCEANFYIAEAPSNFTCQEDSLIIEPSATETLHITASPTKKGYAESNLFISIKNNPKIETIKLACTGCKINFIVTPKIIEFERVIINSVETATVTFGNDSGIPVAWSFGNFFGLANYLSVSQSKGRIKPGCTQEIIITYNATETVSIRGVKAEIQIFEEKSSGGALLAKEFIEFTIEALETTIDYNEHVNFGEVKGKINHKMCYELLNKCTYKVQFEFLPLSPEEYTKEQEHISKLFQMKPVTGILIPNIIQSTELCFFTKTQISLSKVPIFKCLLTDVLNHRLIESFVLKASVKTFLSTYEICPSDEINFGQQLLDSEIFREVKILNAGKFEFSYVFLDLQKVLDQKRKKEGKKAKPKGKKDGKDTKREDSKKSLDKASSLKTNKTSSGKTKGSKGTNSGKRKLQISKLNVGPFVITPSQGVIEPGQTVFIQVSCIPRETKLYQETVLFFASEENPSANKGTQLQLILEGAVPIIEFNNYNFIFKDHYITKSYSNPVLTDYEGPYCNFLVSEQKFAFNKVCVHSKQSAKLHFQNSSSVAAVIQTNITSQTSNVFSVTEKPITIDGYSHNFINITFSPVSTGVFTGHLESKCASSAQSFRVALSGEAFLPEITILKPELDPYTTTYNITFNATQLGYKSSRNFIFKNTGPISCRIILELCDDPDESFVIVPSKETIKLLNFWDDEIGSAMQHTNLVNLSPGDLSEFQLDFQPKQEKIYQVAVKLHIKENPYEQLSISVNAESYEEVIAIENLPACTVPFDSSETITEKSTIGYILDFGSFYVNTLQKRCFKITNLTEQYTYKFEMQGIDSVNFIPATGHLRPKSSKEIIVTFLTKKPIVFIKKNMFIKVYKIYYCNPQHTFLSWDDRQNFITWKLKNSESLTIDCLYDPNNRNQSGISMIDVSQEKFKQITGRGEPDYNIVEDSSSIFPIFLNATSNFSSYELSTREIAIEDTFALEKRSVNFTVKNSSTVPLDLKWCIVVDELLPRRINSPMNGRQSIGPSDLSKISTRSRSVPAALYRRDQFVYDDRKSDKSSLFSTEGKLTARSSDSWCEMDFLPFLITPEEASIPPEETITFQVTFAPIDVFQYIAHLRCDVPNLTPLQDNIDIRLTARSILPLCHFDILPCDYMKSGNLIDENTKVVKFEAIGVGNPCTRKFNIVNPTGESFSYRWSPSETNGKDVFLFFCKTPCGTVTEGKSAEAVFVFTPTDYGTYEAFYIFNIKKYDLKATFLLVGIAREPKIYFGKTHIELAPTVMGVTVSSDINLINDEEEEFKFKIVRETLIVAGGKQHLRIEPLFGIISPKSETSFKVTLNPEVTGEYDFQVKCVIDGISEAIFLNVTANIFNVEPTVFYWTEGKTVVLSATDINVVTIRSLSPFDKEPLQFTIANNGKTGLYYLWCCDEAFLKDKMNVYFKDKEGYVVSGSQVETTITIKPLRKFDLSKFQLSLKIPYGPTYQIKLNGIVTTKLYKFSFTEYDFGACLIQTENSNYYSTILKFFNNDLTPLTLEYKNESQPNLTVDFKSKVIPPQQTETILIYFHPKVAGKIQTQIPFYVNTKMISVTIFGEGVPLRLDLGRLADKLVDFGATIVGKSVVRRIKLVNNSACCVEIVVDLLEKLPVFVEKSLCEEEYEHESLEVKLDVTNKKSKKSNKESKTGVKQKNEDNTSDGKLKDKKGKKDTKKEKKPSEIPIEPQTESETEKQKRLIQESITVTPKLIKLQPKQEFEFKITFSPTERMPAFNEKVYFQCQDVCNPLCIIKGSCLSSEFALDRYILPFGNVIMGYTANQQVVLRNSGDIGSRFKWIFNKHNKNFSVEPSKGYSSPDSDVVFTVGYSPSEISCSEKTIVQLEITNYTKQLELTLTGSCVGIPSPKATLLFECPVREQNTNDIHLTNTTPVDWKIYPEINGLYFYGPSYIEVPSGSSSTYRVTYKPITFTHDNPHEAFIFFALPDGQGFCYYLLGTSLEPLCSGHIHEKFPCKIQKTINLPVKNWLKESQRFQVRTELMKPAGMVLYKLTGNPLIDVQAHSTKDYLWSIVVVKEGNLEMKVIFENERSKEYLFYYLVLEVTKADPMKTINLNTCVRLPISYILELVNPIKTIVNFTIRANNDQLKFENNIQVKPFSIYPFKLEYNPLTTGTNETTLEVSSSDLGTFTYILKLSATPPLPEPTVHFKTTLGSTTERKILLHNPTEHKVEFTATCDNAAFYLSKSITIGAKEQGDFEVGFEPYVLGNVTGNLLLFSSVLGDFIYPLIGTCTLPRPQGPYTVRADSETKISFKNPYFEQKSFCFSVIPQTPFYLKSTTEVIKAKSKCDIIVSLKQEKDKIPSFGQDYMITGKILVTEKEANSQQAQWIFYLKAEMKL